MSQAVIPLIVGADGFIGRALATHLKRTGRASYRTMLQLADAMPDVVPYNLSRDEPTFLSRWSDITHAFICAHFGSIDQCAKDPATTAAVNVTGTTKLLAALHRGGIVPVFFSSNLVFPGTTAWYSEADKVGPTTQYGRQKVAIEDYIQRHFKHYLIIRLTKVYGTQHGDSTLFTSWLAQLRAGQSVQAFDDILVAPISIHDVVSAAISLTNTDQAGIFHCGGPQEQSYAEYARALAEARAIDQSFVVSTKSSTASLAEPRPPHNSLAIGKLKRTIDFDPAPPHSYFAGLNS